jgi:hypothetical protein
MIKRKLTVKHAILRHGGVYKSFTYRKSTVASSDSHEISTSEVTNSPAQIATNKTVGRKELNGTL